MKCPQPHPPKPQRPHLSLLPPSLRPEHQRLRAPPECRTVEFPTVAIMLLSLARIPGPQLCTGKVLERGYIHGVLRKLLRITPTARPNRLLDSLAAFPIAHSSSQRAQTCLLIHASHLLQPHPRNLNKRLIRSPITKNIMTVYITIT